jgi:hypothetical protein
MNLRWVFVQAQNSVEIKSPGGALSLSLSRVACPMGFLPSSH